MIEPLTSARFRGIAPDFLGIGKSDKPTSIDSYSDGSHVDSIVTLIETLGLSDITGVLQGFV